MKESYKANQRNNLTLEALKRDVRGKLRPHLYAKIHFINCTYEALKK